MATFHRLIDVSVSSSSHRKLSLSSSPGPLPRCTLVFLLFLVSLVVVYCAEEDDIISTTTALTAPLEATAATDSALSLDVATYETSTREVPLTTIENEKKKRSESTEPSTVTLDKVNSNAGEEAAAISASANIDKTAEEGDEVESDTLKAKKEDSTEGKDGEDEVEGKPGKTDHHLNGTSGPEVNSKLSIKSGEDSEDYEEEEVEMKPRILTLATRPSDKPDEERDNETEIGVEDDDDEEEDDEDDYEDAEQFAHNVCTAEYFLDKIIPQDYPTTITKEVKHINETIERLNRMYAFSKQTIEKLNPFFREMASRVTDFLYEAQLEPHCLGALFRVIKGITQRKPWALSFFDATGPLLTGGYRAGKFVSLGEFDQCLETTTELPEEMVAGEPIRGQYCLIKPIIPLPTEYRRVEGEPVAQSKIATVNRFLNDEYIETYLGLYKFLKNTLLRVGVCLPDRCDPMDVENALNKFLVQKTGLSVRVGPNCVKANDKTELATYQIVTISILALLIFLVVICSIAEIIYRMLPTATDRRFSAVSHLSAIISTPYSFTSSKNQYPAKYLRQASTLSMPYTHQPLYIQLITCFSLIRNTRVLFEIPAYRRLPLDTLRLMLIFFFFISNAYIYTLIFAPMVIKRFYVLGPLQLATEKKYFFIRMYYLLDVFLTLSGISVALAFKHKSFSYLKYITQNYLRYVAPILFSIGLIYAVPLFGSGPLWHLFDQTITQSCRGNIWPTVLFYNNINDSIEDICNLPTAFVSLIFQMQLLGPLLLLLAYRFHPQTGTILLAVLFFLSAAANVIPRFFYGYKLPYEYRGMSSFTEMKTSVMFYNFSPLVHVAPFIFGLTFGHHLTRQHPVKAHPYSNAIGLFSFIGFLCGFFYMENLDLINSPHLTTFEIVSMLTFGRIPLLTFFCWIIYACQCRCISIVKRFLSSVVWRPLAQLSYGFYITSIIVTSYRLFSIRQTTTLSAENMFRTIVSDAVVSFFLAYLIHIMVQQPMRNGRQILLQWKRNFFECESTVAAATFVSRVKAGIVFADCPPTPDLSSGGTFTRVEEKTCSRTSSPEPETEATVVLDLTETICSTIHGDTNNNNT